MHLSNTIKALTCAALAACAGAASADPLSETFSYQGRLEDNSELANGTYDFQFRVFDSLAGGSMIGNVITRTNVSVADGLFTTTVNFGGIGLIFDGDRRWLEVSVRPAGSGLYTTLGPRTELTTTPYSSHALNAQNAETAIFATTSGTTLDDAYNNGRVIDANAGEVAVENSAGSLFNPAFLRVGKNAPGVGGGGEIYITNNNGDSVVEMSNLSDNSGILQIRNAVSTPIINMQRDTSAGGGGLMTVYRRDDSGTGSSIGFEVNGNWAGAEGTRVTIRGDTNTMTFAADSTGDGSVILSTDAINAAEILNEAGAGETESTSATTLTPTAATNDVLASTTIACPTSGYVLVIATAEVTVAHVGAVAGLGGITSNANFGVNASGGTLTGNQDIELRLDNDLPTGSYDFPVTVHGLFPVGAGSRTFYFVGDQNSTGHSIDVFDKQLSAIFVPTAYGTVSATLDEDGGDRPAQFVGGWTPADIQGAHDDAVAANEERIAAEMAEMYATIQRLNARVEDLEQRP